MRNISSEGSFNDKFVENYNEKYKYDERKVREEKYDIHIITLKQALNNGLVLKKVHRVIEFN